MAADYGWDWVRSTLKGTVDLLCGLNLFAPQNYDAYGSGGSGYVLTAVQSLVQFTGTNPTITVVVPGRYRMSGRGVLSFSSATFLANRTVTLKLRKTSGAAADVANGWVSLTTGTTSLLTGPLGIVLTPSVVLDCAAGDVVSMFGAVDVPPTAGNLLVTQASLNAQRVG